MADFYRLRPSQRIQRFLDYNQRFRNTPEFLNALQPKAGERKFEINQPKL